MKCFVLSGLRAGVVGAAAAGATVGVGQAAAQSIAASDPSIVGFATSVEEYIPVPGVGPAFSLSGAALGEPDGETVSLGDASSVQGPGSITVGFAKAITNGVGADFAVFENAFLGFTDDSFVFAELAFVEVSTNGVDFARFPTTSLTTVPDPIGAPIISTDLDAFFGRDFALIPSAGVDGFAGVDVTNEGTPFDLETLATDPLVVSGDLDLTEVNFVRLIDVPGDGRFTDSSGNPIFDSFDPGNVSGGFDLDAVGVINAVPEPSVALMLLAAGGLVAGRFRRRA
ncbi:MAG: PEP-CTERM sorting domain-containing protein [Planctomycetota bacterium]